MKRIPRTFCISLKETPLRTNSFLELAKKAGLDVDIFHGLLGFKAGLHPKLTNELECPGRNIFLNDGAVGCNLSHLMLWNALKHMPEDEFLVFEDDAMISEDFSEKFLRLYERVPDDWQFIYVGWLPYGKDNVSIPVENGISIRKPAATHAYLVRKSSLDVLCEGLLPIQSNIDLTIIDKCLPKLRYYVFDPSIVSQKTYGNIKDPIWTSLIYDWKSDLYGYKRRMFRELNLGDGWYNLENNSDMPRKYWCWSHETFSIQLPTCIEKISLLCSTPIPNKLFITRKDIRTDHPLVPGDNEIQISTECAPYIVGTVNNPFVPKNHDANSMDDRSLGICLRAIVLDIGQTQINMDISEL